MVFVLVVNLQIICPSAIAVHRSAHGWQKHVRQLSQSRRSADGWQEHVGHSSQFVISSGAQRSYALPDLRYDSEDSVVVESDANAVLQ